MTRFRGRLAVAASFLLLGLLPASPGHADDLDPDYGLAPLPTSCHVDAPRIQVGRSVRLEIEVAANTTTPITGVVDLTISTARARAGRSAAAEVWSRTVRYEGQPRTVAGPRLPKGRYLVTMAFTPDDSDSFVECRNVARFAVGGGVGGEDDGDPGTDGLPDTGGPSILLLLAGGVLCASGAGVLGWSRRRPTPLGTHAAR